MLARLIEEAYFKNIQRNVINENAVDTKEYNYYPTEDMNKAYKAGILTAAFPGVLGTAGALIGAGLAYDPENIELGNNTLETLSGGAAGGTLGAMAGILGAKATHDFYKRRILNEK